MLSHIRLFCYPWTVACRAPMSTGSPGKNTGMGHHSLLQGISPTQESSLGFLHCRQILYHLSHTAKGLCRCDEESREGEIILDDLGEAQSTHKGPY